MADTKISAETAASALGGTELFEGVQSSSNVKVTASQIAAFANASPTITGHATIEGVTVTGATGTGKFVFDTSPTLVTPALGTPSSGTLTNCTGLSLTTGVTGTLGSGNGGTGNAFTAFSGPATSTKTFTLPNSSATILTSAATAAGSLAGTEHVALTDSTYATTQSIADLAFTGTALSGLAAASALGGTELLYGVQSSTDVKITAAQIQTFVLGNSFTQFTGPSSSSKTFTLPNANATLLAADKADQTVSGGANVTSSNQGTKSSGTYTVDCGACPLQYITNGGAFTLAAPSNDGSMMLLVTNNGSAGTITFSGFSVGSNTGDALDTTDTHKFTISIWRINGTSGYRIAAHQ